MTTTPADLSNPASLDGLAGIYAHRIAAALPLNWAQRISLHDSRGTVCWQSAGPWGPAEQDAVRLALERFVGSSAPSRADHDLPEQRTAVLLRAADAANVFRGFVMLVIDNRRLRGKGKSIHDLPVPVQRAAHDWATRMAAAPTVYPQAEAEAELSAVQADRLIAHGPTADQPGVQEFFARLRALPLALVAQPLTPLQRGMRIRRYEVLVREGATPDDAAPVSLLREADSRGLGNVLDRRVAGALIVWLAERHELFADEPAQFSINLSTSSLADPNFVRFIELCLAKAKISPALLAFEVNQACGLQNRSGLQRLSRRIETLGAGMVIDNGALHEELAELLSLPGMRMIKIDRSLTCGLAANKSNQMRVAGIAQMARLGGVLSVAKQVDRPEEQELLRALGVDFLQGRATAQPASLESLDRRSDELLVADVNVRQHDPTDERSRSVS